MSSFVCFNLVTLPVLRKMAGWPHPALRRLSVRTTSGLKLDHERPEYHRATLQFSKCPVQGLEIEGVDPGAVRSAVRQSTCSTVLHLVQYGAVQYSRLFPVHVQYIQYKCIALDPYRLNRIQWAYCTENFRWYTSQQST